MNLFSENLGSDNTSKTSSEHNLEYDSDDQNDNDKNQYENNQPNERLSENSISITPRKSMFKSVRRLSGMPNMFSTSALFSNQNELSDDDISKLNDLIAKFPDPPEKIYVPPSSYSSISSSAAKYLKGFWGNSS